MKTQVVLSASSEHALRFVVWYFQCNVQKKADVVLFAANVEILSITEELVFADPNYDAEMIEHSSLLDPVVETLRSNT